MENATEPVEKQLQQRALTWPEQARALTITDHDSLVMASGALSGIKELRAEVEARFGPMQKAAHAAWQEVLKQRKIVEEPLTEAEAIIKASVAKFETEQKRIAEERERQYRAEAERQQAELIEAQIVEAEARGASVEEVKALAQAPIVAPVFVPRTVQKVAGISTRETWTAEVIDIKKLCRAIADGVASTNLVEPNMSALNGMARALKSTLIIPGVRAVPGTSVTARRA